MWKLIENFFLLLILEIFGGVKKDLYLACLLILSMHKLLIIKNKNTEEI